MSEPKMKTAKANNGKPKPTNKVKGVNPPNKTSKVKVGSAQYVITHYTFALEDDPLYEDHEAVEARGLPKKYKKGFLKGILMQGTGLASDGEYITIDWSKEAQKKKGTTYKYGIGGKVSDPVPCETVAADPKEFSMGTKIEIAIYKEKGAFVVNDTGGKVKGKHIDVFVGALTIAEANKIGRKKSKVTKVD